MVKIHATTREIVFLPRQGLGGKHLVTNGVAWRLGSHGRAAQCGRGYQV